MSKSGRIILVIAMAAAMAACAKKATEEVTVDTVSVEPTETGKYK